MAATTISCRFLAALAFLALVATSLLVSAEAASVPAFWRDAQIVRRELVALAAVCPTSAHGIVKRGVTGLTESLQVAQHVSFFGRRELLKRYDVMNYQRAPNVDAALRALALLLVDNRHAVQSPAYATVGILYGQTALPVGRAFATLRAAECIGAGGRAENMLLASGGMFSHAARHAFERLAAPLTRHGNTLTLKPSTIRSGGLANGVHLINDGRSCAAIRAVDLVRVRRTNGLKSPTVATGDSHSVAVGKSALSHASFYHRNGVR